MGNVLIRIKEIMDELLMAIVGDVNDSITWNKYEKAVNSVLDKDCILSLEEVTSSIKVKCTPEIVDQHKIAGTISVQINSCTPVTYSFISDHHLIYDGKCFVLNYIPKAWVEISRR